MKLQDFLYIGDLIGNLIYNCLHSIIYYAFHTIIDEASFHTKKVHTSNCTNKIKRIMDIFRSHKLGYLEIDGEEGVESNSPGNLKQLNVENTVYIGKQRLYTYIWIYRQKRISNTNFF